MATLEYLVSAELHGGAAVELPHIRDLFIEVAKQYPDVEAVVSLRQTSLGLADFDDGNSQHPLRWTYSQLHQGARHLASKLEISGVHKGSSIAYFSENRAEWILFCWASVLLGCPFVPLNPRLANNELEYVLGEISPSVVVVVGEDIKSLVTSNARQRIEACLLITLEATQPQMKGESLPWISLGKFWSVPPHHNTRWNGRQFEDTVIIGFTSGTTSQPKACPQSSENLMTSAIAVRSLRNIRPEDRLLQHLPGFAAMAVLINLTFLISGATIVYPSPSFSALASLDAIESERCTYTFAAPAIVKALAVHPSIAQRSLKSLKIVELGGAPIYPDVLQLATSETGLNCERVGCGWGMTESPCPLLAEPWERNSPLPKDHIPVGNPIRGTRVKICAPGSITPLQGDDAGELHVGGPQIIRGYLNGTNEAFYTYDGIRWIKTGDMARIENGQVYIIGRYKDIIIRGGHNISPAKIERCLDKVFGVETQVVPAQDEVAGEIPVAVLKLSAEGSTRHDEILQEVHDQSLKELGPTERPQAFITLDRLGWNNFPTTLSGKVQKGKIAEAVWQYLNGKADSTGRLDGESSTETLLIDLWANISGAVASTIDPRASVFTFADSITAMRLSSTVKKQLQKDLSVDDITRYPSIHEQSRLLDNRPIRSSNDRFAARSGPPTGKDMMHCQGNTEQAELTKNIVAPMLQRLGLSWDIDIEDIFPAPDTSYIYLNRMRPQTWNQRVIYIAPTTDVKTLIKTWQAVLIHHPMFRTVAVSTAAEPNLSETKHLFVIFRPNSNFWNCSITTELEVDTPEDLRTTFLNEWADTHSGPLVRIAFVSIKNTNSSAFILVGNHAAYDNLSMDMLLEDLKTALEHKLTKESILQAPGYIQFKEFADTYFKYRTSDDAMEAATFHAARLCGIGANAESLWPKPRAPGYFKGSDEGWVFPDATPGDPVLRKPLDPLDERHGLDGLTRTAPVKTLRTVKHQFNIMPHVILKVAVALFNMRKTGTTTALFANVEAGRKWPSTMSRSTTHDAEHQLNPLSIAGPMFQVVLNRISLNDRNERVMDVLKRVQAEQGLLTKHSQAPLFLISSLLSSSDKSVFFDALARQGYNWAPGIQSASRVSSAATQNPPMLLKFNRQAFDDIGLAWTCGLWDPETFYVNGSYDDCQLGKEEVFRAVGEVLCAGVWLADPDNMGKGIHECLFEGAELSGLIKSLE